MPILGLENGVERFVQTAAELGWSWKESMWSKNIIHENPSHQRWSSLIIDDHRWSSMIIAETHDHRWSAIPWHLARPMITFNFYSNYYFEFIICIFHVIDASSMHHRCGQSENYNDDRRIDEALHHRWSSIINLTDDDTMIKYLMGYIIDASALSSIAHRWSSLRHYDRRWPVIDDLKSSMIIDDHRFKLKP